MMRMTTEENNGQVRSLKLFLFCCSSVAVALLRLSSLSAGKLPWERLLRGFWLRWTNERGGADGPRRVVALLPAIPD